MFPEVVVRFIPTPVFLTALFALTALCGAASADPRVTLHGIRMDPSDRAARDYSRAGWGGGAQISYPLSGSGGMLALTGGLELVNLLSGTKKFQDPTTGLRIEQQTSQNYGRLALGAEMGPHGNGFLRPYAGADVALVFYNITTDVVIPDDRNLENSINQKLRDESEAAFGWAATAGLNLNFGRWGLDGGVRYLKQYGVPQQLGDGAVTVQPAYLQYRLGVSIEIPR